MYPINLKLVKSHYSSELIDGIKLFRDLAFEIENKPMSIVDHCNAEIIQLLVQDQSSSCLERCLRLEALAYGDAGVMLACPGPSLSGIFIRELGTIEQQQNFFEYVRSANAHTFFAVTEPKKGSDANNLQTSLQPASLNSDEYYLNGHKYLVGNGACGSIGIVMTRLTPGPLGMVAVLLTPELLNQSGVVREKLPMNGLCGAQLAKLSFENVPIRVGNILGFEKKSIERGLLGLVKTFNRMRPCVGALALGLAQAILDYITTYRKRLSQQEHNNFIQLSEKLASTRRILHKVANMIDQDPLKTDDISLVKLQATQIVEEIAVQSLEYFGPGAYFEHPWLGKCCRDAFAFEYMEGTTNIHKFNIAKGSL